MKIKKGIVIEEHTHISVNWCVNCNEWFDWTCKYYEHQQVKKCVICKKLKGYK